MTREVQQAEPATRAASGEIHLDASPERVWQALTDARELERWFPLQARVNPGVGGSIWMSWGNEFSEEMPIEVWDQPRHLRTSWPWGNETVVTDYYLTSEGGGTRLRVVTSGFSDDPRWDAWIEGTQRGWAFELRSLKHYMERKEGQDRRALFLRRRVRLSRDETWNRLTGDGGLAPNWLRGERIDDSPPVQVAVMLDQPAGALARVSIEPVHVDHAPADGGSAHDASLWISLWGESGIRLDDIERQWTDVLERAFPDGTTLRAAR